MQDIRIVTQKFITELSKTIYQYMGESQMCKTVVSSSSMKATSLRTSQYKVELYRQAVMATLSCFGELLRLIMPTQYQLARYS